MLYIVISAYYGHWFFLQSNNFATQNTLFIIEKQQNLQTNQLSIRVINLKGHINKLNKRQPTTNCLRKTYWMSCACKKKETRAQGLYLTFVIIKVYQCWMLPIILVLNHIFCKYRLIYTSIIISISFFLNLLLDFDISMDCNDREFWECHFFFVIYSSKRSQTNGISYS